MARCVSIKYMAAKIIALSNQKGGVGKTTACVNVATSLAQKGNRVLVVDLDSQGNATSSLGFFDKNLPNSTYSVLVDGASIKNCIRDTEIKGLKTLPASKDLAGAEIELCGSPHRERALASALEPIEDEFDFVLIDCAPSLSLLTVNALVAANSVIVPLVAEYFALEGLAQMMNTIRLVKRSLNPQIDILGVVINMYDARVKLAREVKAEVEKLFKDRVFATTIPRNVRLAEAPSFGKPIALYDNKCAGAVAYDALVQEIIQKI